MKLDKSKFKRQQVCLRSWRENNYEGTIEAATGFGKTFMGVMANNEMRKTLRSDATTAVVVPTDYLRKKWKQEANLHNLPNVYVDTINGWVSKGGGSFDLLILDEIHGYTGGEVWSTIFEIMDYKRILGLTAKQREKEGDIQTLETYAPLVERVPMSECLENGWVAPFTIYNLGLELSQKDRIYYDKMHQRFIKYFSTFDFDLSKMFACLKDEKVRKEVANDLRWKPKVVMIHAAQANNTMQRRKKWLYTHDLIFDKSIELIKHFSDKRIITFSEVTSFADRLAEAIPESVAYHSSLPTKVVHNYDKESGRWEKEVATKVEVDKKGPHYKSREDQEVYSWKELKKKYPKLNLTRVSGDRQREENLRRFEDKEVDIIHSATALNEGVDIHDIDTSIKNSFNSSLIDSVQRTGRAARIDSKNKNKRAIEINLYIKDTQSVRWLEKSQKETPNVKWIESIQEIV